MKYGGCYYELITILKILARIIVMSLGIVCPDKVNLLGSLNNKNWWE
jgi:hypothetical protein